MTDMLFKQLPYLADTLHGFSTLRCLRPSFLLDSGEGFSHQIDIYSAVPTMLEVLPCHANKAELDEFMSRLNTVLAEHAVPATAGHPLPGWFGVWSYQLGRLSESVYLKPADIDQQLPLAWMGFFPSIVVTDHSKKTTSLYGLKGFEAHFHQIGHELEAQVEYVEEGFSLANPFLSNLSPERYAACFERVKDYIAAGECYQVNLAHRFKAPYTGCPWSAYRALRKEVSAPMGSYFETKDWALLSMSPERFIASQAGQLLTSPIKGTRPRSEHPEKDQLQKRMLLQSQKDRAENLMIVDLLRNDLGRSCEPGSIAVPSLFSVETFTNVHHLVSTIVGTLKPEISPLDALLAAFPGGSITGAPKHRAMEIIDQLEEGSRGLYCGTTLYCDVAGSMDSSILIRSLICQNGQIECWAGGGIVADSTVDQEYQETLDKVEIFLNILS